MSIAINHIYNSTSFWHFLGVKMRGTCPKKAIFMLQKIEGHEFYCHLYSRLFVFNPFFFFWIVKLVPNAHLILFTDFKNNFFVKKSGYIYIDRDYKEIFEKMSVRQKNMILIKKKHFFCSQIDQSDTPH